MLKLNSFNRKDNSSIVYVEKGYLSSMIDNLFNGRWSKGDLPFGRRLAP
ncbi:hypothetical protein J11TS1_13570 [Oceanobacillus sp. J11TS1]|nr:hypothetical protein J11TS1_13570 [Oceanobacillus sp. J11TS1]